MTRPGRQRRFRAARLTRDPVSRRSSLLLVLFLLAFVAAVARLVQVQVVEADRFAAAGAQQRSRTVELTAQRGRIYDRDGDVLATSVDAATVYADPRVFAPQERPEGLVAPPAADAERVARELAPVLDRDPGELLARLRKDAHFVYLARQLDWSVGQRVQRMDLPGVGVLVEPERVYPGGTMGAQLLGFTGIDGEGLHGLELQYDEPLSGEPGRLALEQSPGGLTIAPAARELVPPEPGSDLVLTVDREVQHAAEEAARGAMEEFSAVGAAVVVMEVETGEVLALASEPGFDPNDLDSSDPANRRNRAVTDAFEPGSVQKAVTAAAALEEGVVTPDTTLVVDDEIRVGNKTFSDAHRHDPQRLSFRQVIERSSNVGTIMVAQRLGERRLSRYLRAFGYGQPPGTGFPGESSGLLLPVERWWTTSLPTIAIGQGVAVTPLQTATSYAALANDGVAVEPRLVRGTVGTDGRLAPSPSAAGHRVVSERSARQLQSILGDVVSGERGTGARAAVPGYTVAGKTGTARKPRRDARGYSSEHVASFVGFAPVEDPKVVVSVMVDEPEPIWGGVVAAPVFSDVMEFALVHRRVPPSRPRESLREALAAAERQAAEAAARREGPATDPDQPGSPPVGEPAAPAASGPDAADAPT